MFTARLMLGDWSTGIVFAASAIACRSGPSRPVVATTSGTCLATHVATIPQTASGSEKSITTSAGHTQPDAMATPAAGMPASTPASSPARGWPDRSMAATSLQGVASDAAQATIRWPIRPAAP